MKRAAGTVGNLSAKLTACALVLVCLVVGVIGLILPIVPGLLFLVLGSVILAKHFPFAARTLRRNRAAAGYLDAADRFSALTFWGKAELTALLGAKMIIDAARLVVSSLAGLLDRGTKDRRYR